MISAIVAAIVAVSTLYSAPAVEAPKAQTLQVQETVKENKRKEARCKDQVVHWILEAGFNGADVRVAWAIAQRESNGNPNESSYPDLGLMQLNAPSWQGTKYWPSDVYDPVDNLRSVKKMVRDKGWQPWGLRVSKGGDISYDFSSYSMWSSWQHQNWIVEPFERYYAQFPKKCE